MRGLSYAESGVDIFKEEEAIKKLRSRIRFNREGIGRYLGGHFAGLIEFGDVALVLCTDGVGSKIMIANEMKRWDTIGIDCIAMNVNDCICVGAEPIAFVDYLAMEKVDPKIAEEIGKGLEEGARIANISIAGGETATLPDMIKGLDLAGTCLGYVEKDKIILGDGIREGDLIVGIESSGLHSNGFTLVRKIIGKAGLSYHDNFPDDLYDGRTIGDVLLTPTKIYVREILHAMRSVDLHALVHITGGGVRNFLRLKRMRYIIDDPIEPQPIFQFIRDLGDLEMREMYQTFNMGMGFSVITSRNEADDLLDLLERKGLGAKVVGHVEKGEGVEIPNLKLKYL